MDINTAQTRSVKLRQPNTTAKKAKTNASPSSVREVLGDLPKKLEAVMSKGDPASMANDNTFNT